MASWETEGLARLSKTMIYHNLKRLVDRVQAVYKCSDMAYDLDGLVLDYVLYRCE